MGISGCFACCSNIPCCALHVCASQWHADPIGSSDWTIVSIYFSISRFGVPLFFMIRGALLLNPDLKMDIKNLYLKLILRLVTSLLFWSLLYYAIVVYEWNPYFNMADFDFGLFVSQVLGGHPYQHWFLFAMIGIYMVVPLLRCISNNKTLCRYFLILWGIFEILLTSFRLIYSLFSNTDSGILHWLTQVLDFTEKIKPNMIIGYSGYMMLGYFLHTWPPKAIARYTFQGFGVLLPVPDYHCKQHHLHSRWHVAGNILQYQFNWYMYYGNGSICKCACYFSL